MANAKTKKWNTHIALGYCKNCNDILISSGGGRFVSCRCTKSFIDQERFEANYVRCGGELCFIEQICPPTCKIKEHKK